MCWNVLGIFNNELHVWNVCSGVFHIKYNKLFDYTSMEYIYDVRQVKFSWLNLCINMRWTQPMLANISKTCVQRIPAILYTEQFQSVYICHRILTWLSNAQLEHRVRTYCTYFCTTVRHPCIHSLNLI